LLVSSARSGTDSSAARAARMGSNRCYYLRARDGGYFMLRCILRANVLLLAFILGFTPPVRSQETTKPHPRRNVILFVADGMHESGGVLPIPATAESSERGHGSSDGHSGDLRRAYGSRWHAGCRPKASSSGMNCDSVRGPAAAGTVPPLRPDCSSRPDWSTAPITLRKASPRSWAPSTPSPPEGTADRYATAAGRPSGTRTPLECASWNHR
jgi:hypothetical protein